MPAVEFYWRPGCPFCVRLRWNLRRARIPVSEINIWEDPAAAARVRRITGGDETVPTVVVGARAMVNPSIGEVTAAVRAEAPDLLAAASGRRWSWYSPAVTVGFAALWAVLALRSPTVTYHLAPLLVAAAWPLTHRLVLGEPARARVAAGTALAGLVLALATTGLLVAANALAGPDLAGGGNAFAETLVAVGVGAAVGALAAIWPPRRGRGRDPRRENVPT